MDAVVNGLTDPTTNMVLVHPLVWSQGSVETIKAKHTALFKDAGVLYHQVGAEREGGGGGASSKK